MKSKHNTSGQINAGAMADVAFLLLIFFMVATTLQREKAIAMHLPPLVEGPAQKVSEHKVLTLIINKNDEIMIEKKPVSDEVTAIIHTHLNAMIASQIKPIINVKMHPQSAYQTYLEVLSHVKKAIKQTKQSESEKRFGQPLEKLNRRQYARLNDICGIRIMEAEYADA